MITKSRKWQLTINNPLDKGFSHEQIQKNLSELSLSYWCMCDEKGETYHTHIFLYSKNAITFDSLKTRFYEAHIEQANGTCVQNRNYIRKEGSYADSDKKETNLPDTFYEFGEMPIEKQGSSDNRSAEVLQMIEDGASDYEIISRFPACMSKLLHIKEARKTMIMERYKNVFRKLTVIYIYGSTGVGKTRSVMDKYGYSKVYRVTDYKHPFDEYEGQNVIVFDEFRSSLPLSDMLSYLDGYPRPLPCRYANSYAAYTNVYVISNIPFEEQYKEAQQYEPESFDAFKRRFNCISKLTKDEEIIEYIRGE